MMLFMMLFIMLLLMTCVTMIMMVVVLVLVKLNNCRGRKDQNNVTMTVVLFRYIVMIEILATVQDATSMARLSFWDAIHATRCYMMHLQPREGAGKQAPLGFQPNSWCYNLPTFEVVKPVGNWLVRIVSLLYSQHSPRLQSLKQSYESG